jgi:hypothetical protein
MYDSSRRNTSIPSIVLMDDRQLKRGMIVKVLPNRYIREGGVAIIIGFTLGRTQLPVVVSMGGTRAEHNACLSPREIELFPKQEVTEKSIRVAIAA